MHLHLCEFQKFVCFFNGTPAHCGYFSAKQSNKKAKCIKSFSLKTYLNKKQNKQKYKTQGKMPYKNSNKISYKIIKDLVQF